MTHSRVSDYNDTDDDDDGGNSDGVTFSAGRSGLWSSVKATAVTPPAAFLNPNDDLESPMFARVHKLFRITAQVNVVPENSVSIPVSSKYGSKSCRILLSM